MADDETSTDDGTEEPTDTDVDETSTEADTGAADTDGGEVEDEWKPPSKEEWEKVQRTLDARKEEARKLRAAARSAKKAAPTKRAASKDADTDTDEQPDTAPDDRWKPTAARQSVAAALLEAGFDGGRKAAVDFAGLGSLSDIEVDDEGLANDDDVENVVEALKEKFPRMFEQASSDSEKPPPARRPTTADKTTRDRRAPEMSSSARTSHALLRQGGYRR